MAKNWTSHKAIIIQLYKTESMTLEQVREIMIRDYHFKAG